MKFYILNGKNTIEVDLVTWYKWYAKNPNKRVDETFIDGIRVSTVFLGTDHSFVDEMPILFETMIFGGEHDEFCVRYATWEDAEKGHAKAVELVKNSL